MAYTLANLQDDIRNYTEVDSSVLSDSILNTIIKNAENRIYRDADSDDNRFYATSNLAAGNRYVTIPSDLRFIRYVQLTDASGKQVFLEKRECSDLSSSILTWLISSCSFEADKNEGQKQKVVASTDHKGIIKLV